MSCTENPPAWLNLLNAQLAAWDAKPALRRIYRKWFKEIEAYLCPGISIEIGCGIGQMKEVIPHRFAMDIEKTPWTDLAGDAQHLPFKSRSISNLVMFDVLHHLPYPLTFLKEAFRSLRTGGRLIIVEPYISPVSGWIYRRFHPEPFDLKHNPFQMDTPVCSTDPYASNQAIGSLIFFKYKKQFQTLFDDVLWILIKRFAFLSYPATGGFGADQLLPDNLIELLQKIESVFNPLASLLAFRMMVVLQKSTHNGMLM